ncbi:1,4-dihydroxy-2-naphthoate polyprenyltransferase [Corynebacterium sp. HMSC08F01]|nr:1,4-dihydroxy-2-naphthoate polyprenyltransferase [Corynebacterium sp. HMSC08F01]
MMECMTDSATLHHWWEAARPHTWPNAFAPVIAGTGAAALYGLADLEYAILAFIVAWALIIGVNFANDYSDGIRGTDEDRTGPTRLTAAGLAEPEHVKLAAFASFAVAAVFGIILSIASGAWWLILVGALCIAAAWFYTGGKSPYGYSGLGEVSVFIFFGLVAVIGTAFTQTGFVSWEALLCAIAVGAISASVNLANNIRDIPTDAEAGKRTLAVRLGDDNSRRLFTFLTLVPFGVSIVLAISAKPALAAFIALPFAVAAIMKVRSGAEGKDLIPVLGMNGKAMLIWSVVTALAMASVGSAIFGGAGEPVPYTSDMPNESDFGWSEYVPKETF